RPGRSCSARRTEGEPTMRRRTPTLRRGGSILPLVAVSLIALCGFVALAVDVGMIVVARTQAQTAADAAAMAGARSLDGTPSGNTDQATTNAQHTAAADVILSVPIPTSEAAVRP